MKPKVDHTEFGCITINGNKYEYDVIIGLDGMVTKRNKKLSKKVFGNAHKLSKEEAKYIYQDGTEIIVIGTGQYGELRLSEDAKDYFTQCKCRVEAMDTRKAIVFYNHLTNDSVVAMFHVTC